MKKEKPLAVNFFCDSDYVHTSYVACGLQMLANEKKIKINYKFSTNRAKGKNGLLFSQYIEIPDQKRSITFDMHDSSEYFFLDHLDKSTEYFKANFIQGNIKGHESVVKPFVPYFPVSDAEVNLKKIFSYFLVNQRKMGNQFFYRRPITNIGAYTIHRLKRYYSRLKLFQYIGFDNIKNGKIFYSPGCWSENSEEGLSVNLQRNKLITEFKKNLGSKFIGGFVPNKTSLEKYPKSVFFGKMKNHRDYVDQIKAASINIYTPGVNGCLSWRLGELITAGSPIIGAPLKFDFISSPVENGFYKEALTLDDHLVEILRLIDNPRELEALKLSQFEYFEKSLHPKNVLNQIIFQL